MYLQLHTKSCLAVDISDRSKALLLSALLYWNLNFSHVLLRQRRQSRYGPTYYQNWCKHLSTTGATLVADIYFFGSAADVASEDADATMNQEPAPGA